MKSLSLFFGILLLSMVITAKEQLEISKDLKRDIIGEVFNLPDKQETNAVAYGVASNKGYILKDESRYLKPEMVIKLPDRIEPPRAGPLEVASEIASPTDYYDGSAKLNKVVINCHIYANPTDCLHQNSCGWCGASKSCIVGNNLGPMESCVKSSFIFATPRPGFGPQTHVINENVGGLALTVISK